MATSSAPRPPLVPYLYDPNQKLGEQELRRAFEVVQRYLYQTKSWQQGMVDVLDDVEDARDAISSLEVVVGDQKDADYDSIADAIQSITDAASYRQYNIKVYPGVYQLPLALPAYVHLSGIGAAESIILTGNPTSATIYNGGALTFAGHNHITNMTIKGGTDPTNIGKPLIYIHDVGDVILEKVIVGHPSVPTSGFISLYGTGMNRISFLDCNIYLYDCSAAGSAIHVRGSGANGIQNLWFRDCRIYHQDGSSIGASTCSSVINVAGDATPVYIVNCHIEADSAFNGAAAGNYGVLVFGTDGSAGSLGYLQGCQIINNDAGADDTMSVSADYTVYGDPGNYFNVIDSGKVTAARYIVNWQIPYIVADLDADKVDGVHVDCVAGDDERLVVYEHTGTKLEGADGTDISQTELETLSDGSDADSLHTHGGKINGSLFDAKGDLIVASGDDTPARLAVGANDQVLTADSGEATGVKWAAAGAGSSNFKDLTDVDAINQGADALAHVMPDFLFQLPEVYENMKHLLMMMENAPSFGKIKTGTYTGDGSISQGIAGIGFAPKYVRVFVHSTVNDSEQHSYEKLDQTWGEYNYRHGGAAKHMVMDNQVISLDADGFTVDDEGSDFHPNKNNQAYDYLVLG